MHHLLVKRLQTLSHRIYSISDYLISGFFSLFQQFEKYEGSLRNISLTKFKISKNQDLQSLKVHQIRVLILVKNKKFVFRGRKILKFQQGNRYLSLISYFDKPHKGT